MYDGGMQSSLCCISYSKVHNGALLHKEMRCVIYYVQSIVAVIAFLMLIV
jgi:hypothetical protein